MSKIEYHKTGMTPGQAQHAMAAIDTSFETLSNLEYLFKAIINESENNGVATAKHLAKLGNYHATDIGNLIDVMREQLERGEIE